MNYGVPYKGSKNKIAKWVVDNFPSATNFYDLFAGGCAITHAAILSTKFQNFYANDLWTAPKLFLDAVNGKYANETRWISREEFFSERLKDSYIQFCWSFGNNGSGYMYSKEIEEWKKALHYARVFNNTSIFEKFGIKTDGSSADIKKHHEEYKKLYIKHYVQNVLKSDLDTEKLNKNLDEKIKKNSEELRMYLINGLKSSGKTRSDVDRFLSTNGMAGHYFEKSQWEFPTRENYLKLQSFIDLPQNYEEIYGLQDLLESMKSLQSPKSLQSLQRLERLQSLQSLQSLQGLKRLQSLQGLKRLQSLHTTQGDYREVPIKNNSVIYCDIPYRNTDGYNFSGENDFDYSAFYKWCEKQTELVIVSEYNMPEDFICVNQIEKRVRLSGGGHNKAIEKMFVPKHQIELYEFLMKNNKRYKDSDFVQLEFDFMSA